MIDTSLRLVETDGALIPGSLRKGAISMKRCRLLLLQFDSIEMGLLFYLC